MAQLPAGSEAAAVGVLVWSFFCLSFNVVLLWLLWVCRERRSCQYSILPALCLGTWSVEPGADKVVQDIFIVSWITLLATATSIAEQMILML